MNDEFEPMISKESTFIFAENQNFLNPVDPDALMGLDEQGNLKPIEKKKEKLRVAEYWQRKQKRIALLLFVSTAIPLSILIQETDLLNIIFGNLFNLIILVWEMIF